MMKSLLKLALLLFFKLKMVKSDSTKDEDQHINILDRFSNMTLDKSDEVYFPLNKYFYRHPEIPESQITVTLDTNFPHSFFIKDIEEVTETIRYLYLNASGIWESLKEKSKKEFKSMVCMEHRFKNTSLAPEKLCQEITALLLDVDANEYYFPDAIDEMNYLSGTSPYLPFSFANIFNSDFTVQNHEYFKFINEKEKTLLETPPFTYDVNTPRTNIYHQWTTLIKESPKYWQIHYQGRFLVYVTKESEKMNPVLRIFLINKEGALEVLKGVRLDGICTCTRNIETEELMKDTIILRCHNNTAYGYLFYKINIVDDKLVMIDKFQLDYPLKNCSGMFYDEKQQGFVPKMACVKYIPNDPKIFNENDKILGVAIFDIYDEPLEFVWNPISENFQIEVLRESLKLPELKEGETYLSKVPNIYMCRASHVVHVNVNHRVYKVDQTRKIDKVLNKVQTLGLNSKIQTFEMKPENEFKDDVIFCSTPESVVVFNKEDRNMYAYMNHTIYKMRTDYLKNVEILNTFCLYSHSKFIVVYKEKNSEGKTDGSPIKTAGYCTRYLYMASSRLFYVQEIPDLDAENILPFFYQDSNFDLNKNKSVAYYYIVPPKDYSQKQILGEGNNVDYGMQIKEVRRDIDYPRLKMNFQNTDPGRYLMKINFSSSFKENIILDIPITIHCRHNLEITEKENSPKLITQTEDNNNIFDLNSRYEIKGSLLNAEIIIKNKEIKDQVKLVLPVNYLGYFTDNDKGVDYKKIHAINETIYGITNDFIDIIELDLTEKPIQKSLERYNLNTPIENEIIYMRVEFTKSDNKEKITTNVFVMSKNPNTNLLNLEIFEITDKVLNKLSNKKEIENSNQFTSVEKVEIRKISDESFVIMVGRDHNSKIEYHHLVKVEDEKISLKGKVWKKKPRLQLIDELLVGISNFMFNDYTVNIIGSKVEIVIIEDTKMIFVKLCPELGTNLAFFAVGEMFRFCRLTRIECFYKENDDIFDWSKENEVTDCIVATEGVHMHKMRIQREIVNKSDKEDSPNSVSLREEKKAKEYRIVDCFCTHFYFYPFDDTPTLLSLGNNYFTMSSEESKFVTVYQKDTKNDYPIGSIWKPYGTENLITFTEIDKNDYLIQSSEISSGKIYGLGYFYIKFLNSAVSLKNATVVFNGKFGLKETALQISKNFEINKKPKIIQNDDDDLFVWKTFGFLVIGTLMIITCFMVGRECGKEKRYKKEMRALRGLKRKMKKLRKEELMKLKMREGDLEDEETEYGLMKDESEIF